MEKGKWRRENGEVVSERRGKMKELKNAVGVKLL